MHFITHSLSLYIIKDNLWVNKHHQKHLIWMSEGRNNWTSSEYFKKDNIFKIRMNVRIEMQASKIESQTYVVFFLETRKHTFTVRKKRLFSTSWVALLDPHPSPVIWTWSNAVPALPLLTNCSSGESRVTGIILLVAMSSNWTLHSHGNMCLRMIRW